MTHPVVGLFHNTEDAERAVADLMDSGFPKEKISLLTPNNHPEHIKIEGSGVEHGEDMAIGAVGGGLMGGMLGALVGMVVVAIPGIGPILAAGPLAAAIGGAAGATLLLGGAAGAVGGGVLGALTWAGITKHEAQVYEEHIKEGGTLVLVQCSGHDRERATEILHRDGAEDSVEEEHEWRKENLL